MSHTPNGHTCIGAAAVTKEGRLFTWGEGGNYLGLRHGLAVHGDISSPMLVGFETKTEVCVYVAIVRVYARVHRMVCYLRTEIVISSFLTPLTVAM